MAFKDSDVNELLVASHRRCCICHKFCGVKVEVHHMKYKSKGGSDDIENAIALCFECHAEVNHYNPDHPKGRKFTAEELKGHKKQWLKLCKDNPQMFINAPINRDIGPLEGMLLELEFNLSVVRLVTGPETWVGKIGCPLKSIQYDRAVEEGAMILLPDEVKTKLNEAYSAIGKVNTFVSLFIATRPEGNAGNTAINQLLEALRNSESAIVVGYDSLKQYLSSENDN